jgi:hypothetical protein
MLTLFVVVYGISQRPTLQTAVGDLARCVAFLDIAVFAFYYILYLSMHAFRPHKKNSWLASLAFAKKWAGGRFFFKFLLIFNALVLGPKLDFLAQYRYFFMYFKI